MRQGQPMMPISILRTGGRATMNKACMAFITSLGVTIAVASSQALGAPPAASGGGAASAHSGGRPSIAPHHNGRNARGLFPSTGGWYWWPSGPSNSQPNVDVRQIITGGPSYTCTLDIPGDWAHRCPPSLFASPPEPPPPPPVPYELGCPAQTMTVPGADGKDQTINIVRC
jgi:hypothetical protein